MEDPTLRQQVMDALARPGFGATSEEILSTCRLVAMADSSIHADMRHDIESEWGISPQTWKRMVAVAGNSTLWEARNVLPSNFSSIYRLGLLNEETLRKKVADGAISPGITTRQIDSLKKSIDVSSRYKTSKHSIFLFCEDELDDVTLTRFLSEINQVAIRYNACIDTENLEEIQKENNKRLYDMRRQEVESQIRAELGTLSTFAGRVISDFDYSGVSKEVIDNLPLDLPFGEFVKVLRSASPSREAMMRNYGRLYCLKLAYEFWTTNSRTQRYNCKRRLMDVGKAYPAQMYFSKMILNSLNHFEK